MIGYEDFRTKHVGKLALSIILLLSIWTAASLNQESISREANNVAEDFSTLKALYSDQEPEDAEKHQRIIMIDIDTLRAESVGFYSGGDNSPFIDSFAESNTVFKKAVTPAPWTRAAQMSVFTSTYPRTHGFLQLRHRAPARYKTLAESLREAGYSTSAFTGGKEMKKGVGFEQGFDVFVPYEEGGYTSTEVNLDRAFDRINDTRDQRSFTFIHTYDMHDPYGDTQGAENYSIKGVEGPIAKSRLGYENGTPFIRKEGQKIDLDQGDVETLRKAYDQDLRTTDQHLRGFFDRLKESGLYEDSTIILYSTHGENLGDYVYNSTGGNQDVFGHSYLWPETTQVPLIVKTPENRDTEIETVVSLIDLMPTIYDMIGMEKSPKIASQMEGESLLPLMQGEKKERYVFSENKNRKDVAVTSNDHKLLRRSGKEDMLYKYENGSYDLIPISESPRVYRDLVNRSVKWFKETPETYDAAVEVEFKSDTMAAIAHVLGIDFFELEEGDMELELIHVESLESFDVKEEDEKVLGGRDVKVVKAEGDSGRKLDIKMFRNVSSRFGEDYTKEKEREILSLYQGVVPYITKPGAEKCGEDYQPEIRELEEKDIVRITAYANSEGFLGACEEDAERRVMMHFGYCEDKEVFYHVKDSNPMSNGVRDLGVRCHE